MKINKTIVTTSWDDGSVHDKKIIDLLKKYSIKGTFYIPKEFNYQPQGKEKVVRVSDAEIKTLYDGFEIGAHSLSHSYFNDLNSEQIKKEIQDSKKYLEELLSQSVNMFCYPGGRYNETAVEEVKKAGFLGGRTTELFRFEIKDPFLMPTTINCYPFPFRKGGLAAKIQPLRKSFAPILELGLPWKSFLSWGNLAKSLFDHAEKNKGTFHLWGHSWEIEKNGMWKELEEVLRYISNKEDVIYLTNSGVIDLFNKKD